MLTNYNNNLKLEKFGDPIASSQTVTQLNKSNNTTMLNLNITKNNKNIPLLNNLFYTKEGKRKFIKFCLYKDGQQFNFVTSGKKAKALVGIILSGSKGANALEISNTPAFRLSEYVRSLRHDNLCAGHNLNIITIEETNEYGWSGRYILQDKVEIISDLKC